jgi:hypothetical protein
MASTVGPCPKLLEDPSHLADGRVAKAIANGLRSRTLFLGVPGVPVVAIPEAGERRFFRHGEVAVRRIDSHQQVQYERQIHMDSEAVGGVLKSDASGHRGRAKCSAVCVTGSRPAQALGSLLARLARVGPATSEQPAIRLTYRATLWRFRSVVTKSSVTKRRSRPAHRITRACLSVDDSVISARHASAGQRLVTGIVGASA